MFLIQRPHGKKLEVTAEDVAEVVSELTGIPLSKMVEEKEKLLSMEPHLHKRVIGQEAAVKRVSEAVRRARAGGRQINRCSPWLCGL